jgi:predicted Zn-dependent protease
MSAAFHRLILVATGFLVGISATSAQESTGGASSGLIAPVEVVLYIHSELRSTDFVPPLVCALQRVLNSPVSTQDLTLPLAADLLATRSQFDVAKVADRFIRATVDQGTSRSFKYLLIPFDLKAEPWRYVFATSFGNETTPFHVGIVSTARLDIGDPRQPHHEGSKLTAMRVYKLVLKSIARVAGLRSPDACVLAFPKSLEELDRKSTEFCPGDHAALVAAGILKAKEDSDCLPAPPPVVAAR